MLHYNFNVIRNYTFLINFVNFYNILNIIMMIYLCILYFHEVLVGKVIYKLNQWVIGFIHISFNAITLFCLHGVNVDLFK